MPITLSRTGTLAGIFAAAYRVVPASHLLSDNRAVHRRTSYATAYDSAVTALTEAGLTRDTMPEYAATVLDDLRLCARGQSAMALPVRQQQLRSSLALADAMARLLAED